MLYKVSLGIVRKCKVLTSKTGNMLKNITLPLMGNILICARFEVLIWVSTNIRVCDITPCRLKIYPNF